VQMRLLHCRPCIWLVILLTAANVPAADRLARAATIGPPVLIGTITSASLPEVSGLVDSRANPNTFWVHNDSGNPSEFFAINHQGALLGTFPLSGAPAGDWEDIAMSPKPSGGNYLYLGDIGDNNAIRPFITVYRTDEPTSTASATIPARSYAEAKLQYPGGPRDAESLFVDPVTRDMYIIAKTTVPEIYSVPASAFNNPNLTTVMTALGTLGGPLKSPTAADISPDGLHILARNSKTNTGYLFERVSGESIEDALHRPGIPFTVGSEPQGEAIGWAANGTGFYTSSETAGTGSAPIYSYTFASLAGDYDNNGVVDAADYLVWRSTLGSTIDLRADGDDNGVVDSDDYNMWQANFGATGGAVTAGGVLNTGAAPEPTSIALLCLGAATALAMAAAHRTSAARRQKMLLV
jgi:hypothetical protein